MGFTMLITHLVPGMHPLNNLKPRKPALDGNFQVAIVDFFLGSRIPYTSYTLGTRFGSSIDVENLP